MTQVISHKNKSKYKHVLNAMSELKKDNYSTVES